MVTVSPSCHTRRPRCLLIVASDVREVDCDRPSAVPTGCALQRPGVHDAHHPGRGRPHRRAPRARVSRSRTRCHQGDGPSAPLLRLREADRVCRLVSGVRARHLSSSGDGTNTLLRTRVFTALARGVHSPGFIVESLKLGNSPKKLGHDVYCSRCGHLTHFRDATGAEGGAPYIAIAPVCYQAPECYIPQY